MAETMGTRIHVSDGLPAPREKVSHVLIDALCGAIPSMLYAIAIPLVATSASTVHVVELMAIVGVFVACLLNVASKTSTAFQAYRVPVLACVIATCLAGIVFIAPAREGAFAALNCTLSHANQEFNAYFGLLANGQTVATSSVFAVLAGVLAGILSWAFSRVRTSSVVLLAVVIYGAFSMRLNMGMAAVGSSFAITAWLLQSRFSQLRYSKLTIPYFVGLIAIILVSNLAIMVTIAAFYKPVPQISHASQSIESTVDRVRFGSDSLPQGNLAKASTMNTGSDDCLAIHFDGVPSGDMLLRGFTGATFENGAWTTLPERAFEGDWHGMVSWLAANGLQPSFQRAAFDDARSGAGEGDTPTKTMRVTAHDASTRYVYAPASARSLNCGDVQANLDGTILSGMVGKASYVVEYDDVAPSEVLADASFLSNDETSYARAEAVFSAFSKGHYLDISADDAEAVRTYIFNEETWDETAGESTYAVVSRVRTMLSTVASYTEDPIVEFVVEDGWLKIEGGQIDQNSVVWDTHDNQKVYEGTPLAAYAATATDKYGNALNVEYSIDGKTWTSDPSQITITHFGYQEVQLRATGSNYAEDQYATRSESIAITKRLVTLTSAGGNKPYDGTPLTNGTVTATPKGEGVGFIDGEGASFNVTGSQTETGESDNTFTYTFNEGTNEADYWVTTQYGKLIVTADDTEVVVTITEHGDSVEYDGTEKSVSGYDFEASNKLYKETDFTFSGNDTVKGTNVGTYDMELKPSDFTNNNQNFSKVTFVIVDGQLAITSKSVVTGADMSVKAPADVTYNGQPQQEKPLVKDGEKTLIEGTDYTLSYSSDTTNAGTVTVTVTGKGNYSGSVDVTYQILKRSVTLTSATDSKPYDGTALTRPNVTVTGDGFVGGEVTNIRATGTVSTVAEGEITNTIVYDAGVNFKADNYNITKDEGKLSITALSAEDGLDITPNNVEYTYNAESHSAGSAGANASVPGTNVSLEYRVKGSPDTEWRSNVSEITAINAGTVTIEVRASAANYTGYKYAEQTLTIKKRDVELTSASASKVYDGAPLIKDWVDMGPNRDDTGFIWTDLVGDGQVHATGSQTVVGTSDNTISYQLKEGAANNYNILPENLGTLTVTAQSIVPDPKNPESYTGATISNPSDSVYNGKEHKWTPEVKDAEGNALVEGTDYTVSYGTSDFIDAKTITVTITGTGNYTGTATKTYKITPAPLTVNAESDSKVYDGEALTAGGTIEGLVGDEKANAKTEGSQTEVGSSANIVVGIEWETAKEGNYYIQSQNDGTLTVTGKSIAASDMTVGTLPDVVYSGTEQAQKPEVKDGEKTLVEGADYDLTFSEDKTNVGTVTVAVTGKGNYIGTVTRTYQITPAKLTVATPSDSKVYNGKALTAKGTISGFVNGETAAFTTTGSQTEVGSSTNTYAIDWAAAGNTAKQGNYTVSEELGTLTVTEAADEIVATPGNYSGTYDGQTHGVDVTVTGLPEGYSVKSAVSYATATDVTDGVTANVDDLVIVNAQGVDVTANLKITKGAGTIKVSPATLKVTTYGAKAEYNGSALTADGEVTGFVNNEAAAFTTTGSQTLVGKSTNTYAIDWNDTAKQSNYTVEEELGTLEVTQNQTSIMVIPQGGSKSYDGTALTSAGVTTYGLPAGYTLMATTKGSVTNVGGATAEVDTYSIKNAAGEDVTSQFSNVFTGKATLQVTKRPVTVASESASKVYDGTALTKHEASVTEGSLVTGESFMYVFSGEQTTVGSTSNAYIVKAGANTDLNNYEITKANGTLAVTAQSINPTDPTPGAYAGVEVDSPSDATYDANEHKWVPTVTDKDGNNLVEGADYDVAYSTDDFINVTGVITVTITGKGNYTGTVTRTYQITPASVTLSSNSHEFIYTGEPQGDAAVNVSGAAELFQSQVNDLKATGSVTNVGDVAENSISYNWNDGFTADNYSIETSFGTLSVVAKSIDTGKDMSVNDPVNVTYNGGDQTWAPTVNDGENTLVEGSDYTVSYSTEDRTNVTGAITVTIVGKGNYTGSIEKNYRVLPKGYNVTTATGSKVYDGKPLKGSELEGNAVDGLVSNSDATFEVTGSQTEVGGTPNNNTYELTFASEQMAKNYTLAGEQLGTLTVTEYADEIVVTTTGGTFTYDGQAHGATVLVSELPEGYTLEEAASSASATNVADGKVVATADTLVIRNAQGKDVTDELKIRKIDGEIQIIPAPLSIETGSATKTYDGSALTNATLRVDGLVAGDVVTGRTTGSQTEVGSSANTYTLTWGEVDPANYEISEQLGVLTVEAAVVPVVPDPQQPNGPVVVPPTTPEPAGPADVVADALEGAYETVTGDKAAEEQIYDSENPLGKDQAAHCWVHWYMILVMILTALYGVAVWLRRGNHTRKLKNDMNDILGGGDDGKDPSGSPVATSHPAGMEA